MLSLSGYDIAELIHDGRQTAVFRAGREGRPLVLKVLKDGTGAAEAARFRYECEVQRRLSEAGVAGLVATGEPRRLDGRLLVELEDGGLSLDRAIAAGATGGIGDRLALAVRLAAAVAEIHARHVIHKALTPANVLVGPGGAVRLIDFALASELSSEAAETAASGEGDPAYIAPEQTGRMNRSIDRRADLYGLGGTLYHLFAGRAPFDDPDEPLDRIGLIHAHIARTPLSPAAVNPELPEPLAAVIMKLLEKDAESRYQSAAGLLADLEHCRAEWQERGAIAPFPPGRADHSDRLAIPERLFGRDAEVGRLLDAFERSGGDGGGGVEIMLVRGHAGIGKSVLVGEVQRPIATRHGRFLAGKFDQFLSDQPYAPFIQAFRGLIRRLLGESEEQVAEVRRRLLAALGPNGQVMVDVIPEVGILIGPQPAVPEIGPTEAQNRFRRVFLAFTRVFAAPESPLALFLDDLQWADGPSLGLFAALASDRELAGLTLIAAYRDNEVDAAHPLSMTLAELAEAGVPVGEIALGPLGEAHVGQLVGATLRPAAGDIAGLARLTHARTGGNPFFVNQFLTALHKDGLLRFDPAAPGWRWREQEIEARDYTDNVVDLVTARIRRLPAEGQRVLTLAACAGTEVDLGLLAALRGTSRRAVAEELWPVLRENLLIPVTGSYRLERGAEESEEAAAPAGAAVDARYRFLHDRVQQAADALLDGAERSRIHLAIARRLRAEGGEASAPSREALFDLVNHFNMAAERLDDPGERREVAELNLAAGRRARAAAAFEPALGFYRAGLALLPADAWESDYELALDLHLGAAEAAYLNHDFAAMAALGRTIVAAARTLIDRVRMLEIEIRAWIAEERRLEAVDGTLPVLADLGAGIPRNPAPEDYGAAFGAAEAAIAGRDTDALAALPPMADEHARAAIRILSRTFSVTYFAAPELLPLVIAKMTELSARHGNEPESAFAYTLYGLHLCAFAGEIERGHDFARLSRAVLDRTDSKALRARTLFMQNIGVVHWKEPIRATLAPLLEAYQAGLDTGDFEYSTHALMIHNQHLLAVGHDLGDLHARMEGQWPAIRASKEEAAISLFGIYHQTVANLLGHADDPSVLTGAHHDQAAMLAQHGRTGDRTSLFHIHYNRTVLACLFGRRAEAVEAAARTREQLEGAVAVHQIPLFHFYESLVLLDAADRSDAAAVARADEAVAANQDKVRGWADHAPENNLHRWHLVEAERAALRGDMAAAVSQFEQAAALAGAHRYVQEEALANERHGRFWLARGNHDVARLYLAKARQGYEVWGAAAKVAEMDHRYSAILAGEGRGDEGPALDIESVLKAAEALSGTIALDELMGRMMRVTIESAGARRGVLVLPKKGRLQVAAETAETGVTLHDGLFVDGIDEADPAAPLATSVIRYVHRSGDPVVLDHARDDPRFGSSPHLARAGVRSLLCMPLRHQGKLAAILYLENDLAHGAFTPERLELLRLLSGQMAVSIENARFYDELIALNRAYERFVPGQFLGHLGRESITDVRLGDQVAEDMTVLFLDIRDFTGLSESMTAEDVFAFINGLLGRLEPLLAARRGFIDKYTGDGLMALFPESADDAVAAAIGIQRAIEVYNDERIARGRRPIGIGIGIHSGPLMLGTIGSANRMDGTVISAAVNIASRVEQLNKDYATSLLISEETRRRLRTAARHVRPLGEVTAKGGIEVVVHEVYDADPEALRAAKDRTREALADAAAARRAGAYDTARGRLEEAARLAAGDRTVAACLAACISALARRQVDPQDPPHRTAGAAG